MGARDFKDQIPEQIVRELLPYLRNPSLSPSSTDSFPSTPTPIWGSTTTPIRGFNLFGRAQFRLGVQVNQALRKLRPESHGPTDLTLKVHHTSMKMAFSMDSWGPPNMWHLQLQIILNWRNLKATARAQFYNILYDHWFDCFRHMKYRVSNTKGPHRLPRTPHM